MFLGLGCNKVWIFCHSSIHSLTRKDFHTQRQRWREQTTVLPRSFAEYVSPSVKALKSPALVPLKNLNDVGTKELVISESLQEPYFAVVPRFVSGIISDNKGRQSLLAGGFF